MQARQIKWLPVLMAVTITGIAAFQVYWLSKTYERESRTLERSSNMTFRETVHRLQAARLKLEGISFDSMSGRSLQPVLLKRAKGGFDVLKPAKKNAAQNQLQSVRGTIEPDGEVASLVNVLSEKVKDDTARDGTLVFSEAPQRDSGHSRKVRLGRRARLMQFLYDVDSLQDTLRLAEIHTAFARRMQQQNIAVPFAISRLEQSREAEPAYNEVTLGFAHPITYRLELGNTAPYLLKRLLAPILLSIFIVGITTLSFALLYRNLLRQQRLAAIKNEFISNITHELKTPIATVSVAIEALRSFNATMDVQKSNEYLDISANELQRLSLLVDKVLKLSMFEKHEIELKYEPLDLKALVGEVTASMRLQSEKQGAAIQVRSEGDTALDGDRLHLVSVVFNLLDNALKYSNGAPKIDLAVSGNTSYVTLSITDNGIGIPAEYRDKIFDKFFRVPTGNLHNAKGYGLGLSYVAHVVRRHKGTINVTAATGGGTCFVITLPKGGMSKSKILYVEDELAMAKIVSETLQSRGYDVALESRGDGAVARFKETAPDVCVLDVMLPGKDGFAIADEIRALDERVPIIFLTAKLAVSDVVTGFKRGGNDYIRKPFSLEELIVRIENVLEKKGRVATAQEDEISIGRYTFQKARQVLSYGEAQRKLSYRESELLKLLYENRDAVLERRVILNLLWGSDSFFNSRTLDVYITKLRNYLKQDPAIEIITIKGIGYRFVLP